MLKAFACALEEAIKIANDCSVYQALMWLAGEYLSLMCVSKCGNSGEESSHDIRYLSAPFCRYIGNLCGCIGLFCGCA